MTRLHGALQRATEGKAQILPADAGVNAGDGLDANQPAFSVPWALDPVGSETSDRPSDLKGDDAAAAARRGLFLSSPIKAGARTHPGAHEKLVASTLSDEQASLALAIEQYRKLAATLHHAQADRGLKLIMVTSANPGEGKSLTASNLALTLSESYQRRVLLIDADLRRPSLHDVFDLPNGTGLGDALARDSVDGIGVVEVSKRLSVLPSGRPMEDPTSALTSDQMMRILYEARAAYDWAIIDTPPVGVLSDAKLLSEKVDGVVIVVEAGKTGYPDLLRAIDTLGRERVMGVVLNRLENVSGGAKYYSSYYRRPYGPGA